MSDSMRPHRWQPTRLLRPWDSPGKNTGVGCHFLLQCMKVKSESEVTESCPTLSDPMDCSPLGSSVHGIFQARVLEWGAIAFSVGHAGTHLFPASVALCLLQMRAEIRGHVQPHKGTEEEIATHSSVLAWRIPGMEPGGLLSMGSHRVRHD